MPMKMGIHCKPIGHGHSTSLDSRVCGNDGGMFFPRKRLTRTWYASTWTLNLKSRLRYNTDELTLRQIPNS